MQFLNNLFFLTYIAILFLSFFLYLLAVKNITRPSIITFFYFIYLFFAYLGIPLLYYKAVPYYVDIEVINKTTIWLMLLASGSSLIFLLFGAYITSLVFEKIYPLSKKREVEKKTTIVLPLIFFLFSTGVLIFYLLSLEGIPLIEALKGAEEEEISQYRFQATAAYGFKYNWISLFINSWLPFLSFLFFSSYLLNKNRVNLIIFLLTFPVTFFALIASAQKAPVVFFLIGLFLIAWYTEKITLNSRVIFLFGIFCLLMLFVMYSLFMPASFWLKNLAKPIQRATISQIAASYYYLEYFPREKFFLLGRSFPNPKGIFPYENYPLAVKMMDFLNPDLASKNRSGSANTVFWAEIYANFGFSPLPFISFFLGVALYFIETFFEKGRISPLKTALFAWIALFVSRLALTSFSTLILTPSLFGILFIALLFKIFLTFKEILYSYTQASYG